MSDRMNDLRAVFCDELGDDSLVLAPETRLFDIPGWDSVTMSCVILGTETQFDIMLSPAEMDGLESFGDLWRIVEHRLLMRQ